MEDPRARVGMGSLITTLVIVSTIAAFILLYLTKAIAHFHLYSKPFFYIGLAAILIWLCVIKWYWGVSERRRRYTVIAVLGGLAAGGAFTSFTFDSIFFRTLGYRGALFGSTYILIFLLYQFWVSAATMACHMRHSRGTRHTTR